MLRLHIGVELGIEVGGCARLDVVPEEDKQMGRPINRLFHQFADDPVAPQLDLHRVAHASLLRPLGKPAGRIGPRLDCAGNRWPNPFLPLAPTFRVDRADDRIWHRSPNDHRFAVCVGDDSFDNDRLARRVGSKHCPVLLQTKKLGRRHPPRGNRSLYRGIRQWIPQRKDQTNEDENGSDNPLQRTSAGWSIGHIDPIQQGRFTTGVPAHGAINFIGRAAGVRTDGPLARSCGRSFGSVHREGLLDLARDKPTVRLAISPIRKAGAAEGMLPLSELLNSVYVDRLVSRLAGADDDRR